MDGGQLWLGVLGEEERLLDPPEGGRGLPAQGSCRSPSWILKEEKNKKNTTYNCEGNIQISTSAEARQDTQIQL